MQPNNQQPNMTEKELLNDLLNQEKQIASNLALGVSESSCQNLRQVLTTTFEQTSQDQFCVFDQMSQRGYYPVKNAQPQDVQMAKQQFSQMQQQLV